MMNAWPALPWRSNSYSLSVKVAIFSLTIQYGSGIGFNAFPTGAHELIHHLGLNYLRDEFPWSLENRDSLQSRSPHSFCCHIELWLAWWYCHTDLGLGKENFIFSSDADLMSDLWPLSQRNEQTVRNHWRVLCDFLVAPVPSSGREIRLRSICSLLGKQTNKQKSVLRDMVTWTVILEH